MDMHVARVPIVPAAALFDLAVGRADVRPGPRQGHAACEAASTAPVEEGCVGAGTGATVGKLGGLEWHQERLGRRPSGANGPTVAALVAVNAFGDVVDPTCGRVIAGCARPREGTQLRRPAAQRRADGLRRPGAEHHPAVVATDAVLSNVEATKVARMATTAWRAPSTRYTRDVTATPCSVWPPARWARLPTRAPSGPCGRRPGRKPWCAR